VREAQSPRIKKPQQRLPNISVSQETRQERVQRKTLSDRGVASHAITPLFWKLNHIKLAQNLPRTLYRAPQHSQQELQAPGCCTASYSRQSALRQHHTTPFKHSLVLDCDLLYLLRRGPSSKRGSEQGPTAGRRDQEGDTPREHPSNAESGVY